MDQEVGLREGEIFSQVTELVTELVSLTLKSVFPAPFLLSQLKFPQKPVAKVSTVSWVRDNAWGLTRVSLHLTTMKTLWGQNEIIHICAHPPPCPLKSKKRVVAPLSLTQFMLDKNISETFLWL